MRLGVFRADADGRRTAGRLKALGHEAVLAPVIEIRPTGVIVDSTRADIVVFTSQHAPEALRTDAARQRLVPLPCFCVGARTAAAAEVAGFRDVRTVEGDAAALVGAILRETAPSARIAFVAGRDRKPTLEDALERQGFVVTVTEAYAACALSSWPGSVSEQLRTCDGVLHYSRRTARLTLACATAAGLSDWWLAARHHCLSHDIADWLRITGAADVRAALTPDEDALMVLLQSAPGAE